MASVSLSASSSESCADLFFFFFGLICSSSGAEVEEAFILTVGGGALGLELEVDESFERILDSASCQWGESMSGSSGSEAGAASARILFGSRVYLFLEEREG